MKQSDRVQRAYGYLQGINRAIEIFNFVDAHTALKLPILLIGLLQREISTTQDWIKENTR